MIKKFLMLSVITIVMTLFLLSASISTYAATKTYEDGYMPLNESTSYVDEIKPNIIKSYSDSCCTEYASGLLWSSKNNGLKIIRKRIVYGETSDNYITTEFIPYQNGLGKFILKYNDVIYIEYSMIRADNIKIFNTANTLNFNDPTKPEYQNCERVRLGAPETTIENNTGINMALLTDYEDLAIVKTYESTNTIEISKNIIDVPTREELLHKPIELGSGLKIDESNNFIIGGNYVTDSNGFIENGTYYFKVGAKYENKLYSVIYKINVLPINYNLPEINTNVTRQVTLDEIKSEIDRMGIVNYEIDQSQYLRYFDVVGNYIINVNVSAKGKTFAYNLPIIVSDTGDNKIKLKNKDLLTVGYNEELDYEAFKDNIDFSYILLKEYTINYDDYIKNKDKIGSYLIHIKAIDTDDIIYIQSYFINVVDDVAPTVSINGILKTKYSYKENVSIESIKDMLKVEDKSKVTITYNSQDIDFSIPGEYVINFIIKDEYQNETMYPVNIEIVDDIAPKIIVNDIQATTDLLLTEDIIKSQIYANDEIDGKLSKENISIIDINNYSNNYDKPGTYRFEATATDSSGNEGYSSFNIVVNAKEEEIQKPNDNTIVVDRDVRLTEDDVKEYLVDKGYIDSNAEVEISSDYFTDEQISKDTYDLEVKNGDNINNYEIKIKENNVSYDMASTTNENNESSNLPLIITFIIIGVLAIASGILIFVIYKKRH